MPDLHTVLFDYHGIPVYVRLDLGTETPELARFMGPKGILDAGEFELRHSRTTGVDTAPSYYSFSFPAKMRDEYVKQWHAEHDRATRQGTGARRYVSIAATTGTIVRPHLQNFFQSVKSRKPVTEDAVFGNHAAIACHMANESYFRKKPVYVGRGVEDDQVTSGREHAHLIPSSQEESEDHSGSSWFFSLECSGCRPGSAHGQAGIGRAFVGAFGANRRGGAAQH